MSESEAVEELGESVVSPVWVCEGPEDGGGTFELASFMQGNGFLDSGIHVFSRNRLGIGSVLLMHYVRTARP